MPRSADFKEAASQLVKKSRKQQGFPERITDPVVLAKVAQLVRSSKPPTK